MGVRLVFTGFPRGFRGGSPRDHQVLPLFPAACMFKKMSLLYVISVSIHLIAVVFVLSVPLVCLSFVAVNLSFCYVVWDVITFSSRRHQTTNAMAYVCLSLTHHIHFRFVICAECPRGKALRWPT